MSEKTLPQPPRLLADPEQVALLRNLYAHARHIRAEHATYAVGDGHGRRISPVEHTWTVGESRVSVEENRLTYWRRQSALLVADVTSVRQVADLLAAIGVLPQWFASAYHLGRKDQRWVGNVDTNPDRKCRRCGAASGLKMGFRPPGYTPDGWECTDGCEGGAR